MSSRISRLLETIVFLGTGSVLGALLALAIELTGHRWWALLMLLTCALGPSLARAMWGFRAGTYSRMSRVAKVTLVLLMIAATLTVEWSININPRDYAYVPLLPPVLLSALFFGFGHGVLAIVICTIIADYFFSLPVYDFRIAEMKTSSDCRFLPSLGLVWRG
jgi:hypothetical protein